VAIGDDVGDAWDYAALVQYPRPAAFVETVGSAAYQAINHHRQNALERHLIVPVAQTYSKLAPGR
jgi:hypothetical protein